MPDMINSRQKGKRGERMWRDELRAQGFTARRGQQYAGGTDSPDVICDELAFIHFECKFTQAINLEKVMREQATKDAGDKKMPVIAHKKNNSNWLVTLRSEDFFELIRNCDLDHFKKQI